MISNRRPSTSTTRTTSRSAVFTWTHSRNLDNWAPQSNAQANLQEAVTLALINLNSRRSRRTRRSKAVSEHQPALRCTVAMRIAWPSIWTAITASVRLANRWSIAWDFRNHSVHSTPQHSASERSVILRRLIADQSRSSARSLSKVAIWGSSRIFNELIWASTYS